MLGMSTFGVFALVLGACTVDLHVLFSANDEMGWDSARFHRVPILVAFTQTSVSFILRPSTCIYTLHALTLNFPKRSL